MKRIIIDTIIIIYVVIVLGMSLLLLNYNEYKVTEIGKYTLLLVDDDMYNYKEGSVLLVKKAKVKDIKAGDLIFYYDTSSQPVKTVLVEVSDVNASTDEDDVDFVLPNGSYVNSSYVFGTTKTTTEKKGWGTVLSVFESKWGNLFLIVVPAFFIFMYELINFIFEIKMAKEERY